MKTKREYIDPGNVPGGRVNQDFYDDSSAVLGLNHSAYSADPERLRQKQLDDKAAYLEEIGAKDKASRLIEYYRNLGMRPKDAEDAGVERFLSLAAGVYDRIWRHIDAGMELDAAILKAEMEITEEADIEARADGDGDRPARDSYLGDSVTNLMDAHRKTTGGGSRSSRKGRKTRSAKVEQDSHYQELIAQADTRPELVSGRVTERVKVFLQQKDAPASAGEIVEVVVDAMIRSGCTLSVIQEWLACGIEELSKGDAA